MQPTFQTAVVENKFTVFHIKQSIYIWKTKSVSQNQYFLHCFTSTNAKKTETEMTQKLLKVPTAKTLFSSVYVIGMTYFNDIFLCLR